MYIKASVTFQQGVKKQSENCRYCKTATSYFGENNCLLARFKTSKAKVLCISLTNCFLLPVHFKFVKMTEKLTLRSLPTRAP